VTTFQFQVLIRRSMLNFGLPARDLLFTARSSDFALRSETPCTRESTSLPSLWRMGSWFARHSISASLLPGPERLSPRHYQFPCSLATTWFPLSLAC